MPTKLSNLRDNSKSTRIVFSKDDYIDVTFYPNLLTQDVIDRYQDAVQDHDYDLAAQLFGEVVTEWDLLGDDGKPLPINGHIFRMVGIGIMAEVWDRIADTVAPKSRNQRRRS